MGKTKINHEVRSEMGEKKDDRAMRWAWGVFGVLLVAMVVVGGILSNIRVDAVEAGGSARTSVNVAAACTLSGGGNNFVGMLVNGTTVETSDTDTFGATTPIRATCNDPSGFALYAVGYSGDVVGQTDLIASIGSSYNIVTGTSGDNSYWGMKLVPVAGIYTPIISGSAADTARQPGDTDYSSYAMVPDNYIKVAYYTSNTDMDDESAGTTAAGASVTPSYQIHISSTQPAGTYTGKVKYVLVHPNTNSNKMSLYDLVASMSKGKQTATDLQQPIVTPTAETTVSTNSGVYEYNAEEFGEASDAANTKKIYYYRGVLDSYNGLGDYGSDGQADAYPNYVILSAAKNKTGFTANDTCWRIVRTTGSGGVKIIYNGKWTGRTCANTRVATLTVRQAFNAVFAADFYRIVRAGYTYNADYDSVEDDTEVGVLFGTNSSYSGNSTNSLTKNYIENTWFVNIGNYKNILENSAGYCNDRTIYDDYSYGNYVILDETAKINRPYGTNATGYHRYNFGAFMRNMSTDQNPSLTCPRDKVDLYTVSGAPMGNGQLAEPAALLTADEASFAGSGRSIMGQGSSVHDNSYLHSGIVFWFLSPSHRLSTGGVFGSVLLSGVLNSAYINNGYGVRPVISLIPGTVMQGGYGTATDPWIVNPPEGS